VEWSTVASLCTLPLVTEAEWLVFGQCCFFVISLKLYEHELRPMYRVLHSVDNIFIEAWLKPDIFCSGQRKTDQSEWKVWKGLREVDQS